MSELPNVRGPVSFVGIPGLNQHTERRNLAQHKRPDDIAGALGLDCCEHGIHSSTLLPRLQVVNCFCTSKAYLCLAENDNLDIDI